MFPYYGKKAQLAKYYQTPVYDTIIEPFAGSAAYSLYGDNWRKKVILMDKDPRIVRVWQYLQMISPEIILSLPEVKVGEDIRNLQDFKSLREEELWLMGFCINPGSSTPKHVAGKFNKWSSDKKRIADNLYKIRHWTIALGSYDTIDNYEATWFIDPPYFGRGGQWYKAEYNNKNINYSKLADWCKSRKGQVIVCENSEAGWLPFIPLRKLKGQLHDTEEVVYYQIDEKYE